MGSFDIVAEQSSSPPSMNTVISFTFDNTDVRALTRGGELWFVLADVCAALGLSNPSVTAQALDDDERAKLNLGRQGEATVVSEAGLYTIVLRCREATTPGTLPHRFRRWVTGEVLPQVRKTGSYGKPAADPTAVLNDPTALRALLLENVEQRIKLAEQVAADAPKVRAFERIAGADGSLNLTETAKALQMRRIDLQNWLVANRWIYRKAGSGQWLGYRTKEQSGVLTHKVSSTLGDDGVHRIHEQVRCTPKGLAALALAFGIKMENVA